MGMPLTEKQRNDIIDRITGVVTELQMQVKTKYIAI